MNIEEYVRKTSGMANVSVGGSACFDFGEVVLVKYHMPKKYGRAREGAEEVMEIANKANSRGVRTPKHIAIFRETVGDEDFCWVLQEKAKGVPYTKYTRLPAEQQIEKQKEILNAPDTHFDTLVLDLCELAYSGIEMKSKNIFYDKDEKQGGFTIIDLLGPRGHNRHFEGSISDALCIYSLCNAVIYPMQVYSGDEKLVEESKILTKKLEVKIFKSMERSFPNFEKNRRWLLRTIDKSDLDFFSENGVEVGDLSLTKEELGEFEERSMNILSECIKKLETGTHLYWQIEANELRNMSADEGLSSSWAYHPDCKIRREDYDSDYEFSHAVGLDFQEYLLKRFKLKLNDIAKTSTNENLHIANREANKPEKQL